MNAISYGDLDAILVPLRSDRRLSACRQMLRRRLGISRELLCCPTTCSHATDRTIEASSTGHHKPISLLHTWVRGKKAELTPQGPVYKRS